MLRERLEGDFENQGSNWWVVSGALTESGFPMFANDPHLSLGTPATFYEIHLSVDNGINVAGVSFPGTPGVILGCNDTICSTGHNLTRNVTWTSTVGFGREVTVTC